MLSGKSMIDIQCDLHYVHIYITRETYTNPQTAMISSW